MNSFIDRIQYFMLQTGINNNQMTVAAGLSVGLIGRAIKSKSGLNSDSIEKILYAYPELNPNWLLTGRGEMLITNKQEEINAKANAKVNAKESNENTHLPPQSDDFYPHPSITSEPKVAYTPISTPSHNPPPRQYSGANDIIMNLVDRLNEQAEEIGALRQENSALKHRIAQLVEDAGDVSNVPA